MAGYECGAEYYQRLLSYFRVYLYPAECYEGPCYVHGRSFFRIYDFSGFLPVLSLLSWVNGLRGAGVDPRCVFHALDFSFRLGAGHRADGSPDDVAGSKSHFLCGFMFRSRV